jgi:CRISPR-associated protein (TIGR03985 family)
MPEFKYPPTIQVLQALFSANFTIRDFANVENLNKAIRLWYTLRELATEFQKEQFTDRDWRKKLYGSQVQNPDRKPEQREGCLSTKTIAEVLFSREDDRVPEWPIWKKSLEESVGGYFRLRYLPEEAKRKLNDYLKDIESAKPFNITGKTIQGDLKSLAKLPLNSELKYLITLGSNQYKIPSDFPPIDLDRKQDELNTASDLLETQNLSRDPGYLSDDFSSFAYLFTEPTRDIQRFYIHADYQMPEDRAREINEYLGRLKVNWSKDRPTPYQLEYYSSSKPEAERRYTIVVYPVCIYYYQRSFYLCALDGKLDTELGWHNYRLDRIESLKDLDWEEDRGIIPQLLVDRCVEAEDSELIDEVDSGLTEAYGFDFYQDDEQTILRFDREFHDRYIKNTFRHQTFKSISMRDLLTIQPNLKLTIDRYPDDAYYTMQYRIGDNSVIMRLRAWCPNVEVLSPPELRDRMRDDIRQTWEFYREEDGLTVDRL